MEESLKIEPTRNNNDNICLACGLCCDGSFIGLVHLEKKEITRIKKLMNIEEIQENGFFLQACSSYCDGCTIYDERPTNCDKFNCGLLKSVENKEIQFDYAVKRIQEVKQRKKVIIKQITLLQIELKSPSFYFKIMELKKVLNRLKLDTSLTQGQKELLLNIQALDTLFEKEFGVSLD